MDLNEHPEFKYAPAADVELVYTAKSPSEWPSDAAARVCRSMIIYTREVLEESGGLLEDQREMALESFDANLEMLKVLEAQGKTPVDSRWAKYFEEVSKGCNQVLISLEK